MNNNGVETDKEIRSTSDFFTYLDFSLTVPNKVSMARDQLAAERNYLTFLRFSCTLIVIGFTLLTNFRLPSTNKDTPDQTKLDEITRPIGYVFVAAGLFVFISGLVKYFRSQYALVREVNYIQSGVGSILSMVVIALFVIGVMILSMVDSASYVN